LLAIRTFVQPVLRTYGVNAWRFTVSSLPERPNLGHLRKQAKELFRQYRAHDPAALAAFRQYLPAAKNKSDAELSTMLSGLRDAQSCVARQYGFPSWQELKHHVEAKQSAADGAAQRVDGSPTNDPVIETQKEQELRYAIAQMKLEQARPRTAVPFDPDKFDKYVGYYKLDHSSTTFTHIFGDGERFFEQLNIEKRAGVAPVEFFPESETKFFATRVASQISFVTDAQGQVTGLVFHQGGFLRPATRVDKSVVDRHEAAVAQRIKDNTPSPGTEAFLLRYIAAWEKGEPNFDALSPGLARLTRRQRPMIEKRTQLWGAFKALSFKGIDRRGWDVYQATFTRGEVTYSIAPLPADGKVTALAVRHLP
jgi:hypothetical protein